MLRVAATVFEHSILISPVVTATIDNPPGGSYSALAVPVVNNPPGLFKSLETTSHFGLRRVADCAGG
jgi:hypothetical protein